MDNVFQIHLVLPAVTGFTMTYAMTNISLNRTLANTTQFSFVPKYPFAVVLFLIQLFGISGNIMVIYSIVKHRDLLQRNYYYLVLHLAICDLTVLVLMLGLIWFAWSLNSYFTFGQFTNVICYIWRLAMALFLLAGCSFMIVIAIFRYRAVLYPLKPAVSRSKLRVIVGAVYICVTICKVAGSFLSIAEKCLPEWPSSADILHIISFSIQWLLPVAVLSILYYKICRELRKQSKKMDSINATCASSGGDTAGTQTHLRKTKHRRNTRTVITSITIVVCFAVTRLPIIMAAIFERSIVKVHDYLYAWTVLVQIIGACAVNPYIYGMSDETLRSVYQQKWNKVKAFLTLCSRQAPQQ